MGRSARNERIVSETLSVSNLETKCKKKKSQVSTESVCVKMKEADNGEDTE